MTKYVTSDGVRLHVEIAGPDAAPTVVLVHGFKTYRTEMFGHARFLHDAGYAVLAYDGRGCAASDGVFGVGAVWLYPLVGSAARALAGRSSTAAISAATGTTRSLPKLLDGPVLIRVARVFRDLLEATTSIRVMPTSRW